MARRPITAADLERRLKEMLPSSIGFAGTVYRSCTRKYAREADLLNGLGSKRYGGRWNPPGLAAVYASLTPETAMAETLAHFRYYGIPIHATMPRTFVAIEVRLSRVLDLTDTETIRLLQVYPKQLTEIDWRKEARNSQEPLTQQLGRLAAAIGLEGVRAPSAALTQSHNLVVFPANLGPTIQMKILNTEGLNP